MQSQNKERAILVGKYCILLIVALVVLIPIVSVIFSSFKTDVEYYSSSRLALPESFLYVKNFVEAFIGGDALTGMMNTVIILALSLFFSTLFGTMVSYVLARFEFKGKKFISGLYLIAAFIPMVSVQIVVFKMVQSFGLVNTYAAPVLLYSGVDILTIYIYLQFIKQIPYSLDEAAMIEGSSYFRIFGTIILPMVKPAIVTACIMKGTNIYNDFYTAFLYLPDSDFNVMSTMLHKFIGPYSARWNVIAAGILIVVIPMVIVFIFLQKKIYKGFIDGAIKG